MVNIQSAMEHKENPEAVSSCTTGGTDGRTRKQAEEQWPSLQVLCTPRSVDGEAQGAVHLLADEAGRAVLRRGSRGHSVREQRALLGRRLRQLGLLQLSATQGQRHTQRIHSSQRHSIPTTAGHRSILGYTESVMIHIHLFPTRGAEVGSLLV